MKFLALLALAACVCQVYSAQLYDLNNAQQLFNNFVRDYSKKYKNWIEKETRFQVFRNNLIKFNELNMDVEEGGAEFGINQFSDLTTQEFVQQYTGLKAVGFKYDTCDIKKTNRDFPNGDAPSSFDWRQKNVVTRVKNQVSCGSCWAFSAIGNVESQNAIKYNTLVEFSEQQLVDCDKTCYGCNGGYMSSAFKYLVKTGGADTEAEYPYTAMVGTCDFKPNDVKVKLSGCISYNFTSQESVKQALYKTGPISIGIYAEPLQGYKNGILSAATCGTGDVDHGVLLVGYGDEAGKAYWIVKNSWGADFGENGYFRMERHEGLNTCMFLNQLMASAIVA